MGYTPEERKERARKAGLAAAAKRKAKQEAGGQTPPSEGQVLSNDTPPAVVAEPEVLEDGTQMTAPILPHDRVHPKPLDIPPPERPINWGAMTGRMASRTLEEAMAGGPPVSADEMAALNAELSRPVVEAGMEMARFTVRGTDMGAGMVYVEEAEPVPISEVVRTYTTDIPGPGDSLVLYEGKPGVWLVKKDA